MLHRFFHIRMPVNFPQSFKKTSYPYFMAIPETSLVSHAEFAVTVTLIYHLFSPWCEETFVTPTPRRRLSQAIAYGF